MRLGQLARKLAIRPAEIVEFLSQNHIQIEDTSNTRIEDEHVRLVVGRYAPEGLVEPLTELESLEIAEVPEESDVSEFKLEPEPSAIASETTDVPEVIRAAKVELPGLKVLGKIEFPEPKKKDPAPASEDPPVESAAKPVSPERRRKNLPRREERPKSNPIAIERDRQAREAERKRKEEIELKKQQKKEHYLKKVKAPAPTRSVRLMDEPLEVMPQDTAPQRKTGFGRFLRWLKS